MKESSRQIASRERVLDSVNRELYARNVELAVRNKTLSLLRDIDEVAMASLVPTELTGHIAEILVREFSFPFVAIAGVRNRALEWLAVSCKETKAKVCTTPVAGRKMIPLTMTKNLCVKALKTGRRQSHDWLGLAFSPSFSPDELEILDTKHEAKNVLVFPLRQKTTSVGVLALGLNRSAEDLTRHERETLENLLSLIVIALQKAQTYQRLRETTRELRQANRKLKAVDAMKTEFLSIASHQLRTPLAVTKGYIAMLEDGMVGKVTAKQRVALEHVRQSTESLILLVNHLLDLSRIETGKLVVRLEDVDVAAVVKWVGEFMSHHAKEKSLDLIVRSEHPQMIAKADPEKLKEIILNIVDNAIKYTEKGHVHMRIEEKDHHIIVVISDTGYGLSREDKEHLFEKFARGSASKYVQTTTGLGLYVCKRLVEGMNGTIRAESAGKGKGSTFTITLPRAR